MIKGILQEMLKIIKDNSQPNEIRVKLIESVTSILTSEELVSKLRKPGSKAVATPKSLKVDSVPFLKHLPIPLPERPRVHDITMLEELQEAISGRRISIEGPQIETEQS